VIRGQITFNTRCNVDLRVFNVAEASAGSFYWFHDGCARFSNVAVVYREVRDDDEPWLRCFVRMGAGFLCGLEG